MLTSASVHMLLPGDILAIYAGPVSVASAVIQEPGICRDDYTPGGHVTLNTTMGRFDVPDDSHLDVLAWAPMPLPGTRPVAAGHAVVR